jgi:hypothetical protein
VREGGWALRSPAARREWGSQDFRRDPALGSNRRGITKLFRVRGIVAALAPNRRFNLGVTDDKVVARDLRTARPLLRLRAAKHRGIAHPQLRDRHAADAHVICDFVPEPYHEAFENVLCGGIIGTLLDCHMNWTTIHHLMRKGASITHRAA